MTWLEQRFASLFAAPLRNGVVRPKRVRGAGVKMVCMRELFMHGRIGAVDMERVPASEVELGRFGLQAGDLLFARQSLVASGAGQCSLVEAVPEPTVFESHLIRVRLDLARAVPAFYYHFFRSPHGVGRVQAIVNQVAAAGIRGSELETLRVPVPPLATQRRIAAVLGAYDRLLALDTLRMAVLEELARKLYVEWFQRFRFPGHERAQPRTDSPIGPIPAGWSVATAAQVMQVRPRTRAPKRGDKPFVPMSALATDSMLITTSERRAGTTGAKFKNGDTLFARISPCLENGKTGFVQLLPSDDAVGLGSTELIVLRADVFSPEMVYLLTRTDSLREQAKRSMSGASGRQRVQEACFSSYTLAVPPPSLIEAFTRLVRPMFRQIAVLARRRAALIELRDLLARRLISGDLDVTEVSTPTTPT